MPKRISIKTAKEFAEKNKLKQVIIVSWDGKLTHVVTYGRTVLDNDLAAQAGNLFRQAMCWDASKMIDPLRVVKLKKQITALEERLKNADELNAELEADGYVCGALVQNNGNIFKGGCGENVPIHDSYRCADCTASFHRECIQKHFKNEKNKKGNLCTTL